jgi:hypothetical protein
MIPERRHGGPYDRGSADYYYWRACRPHFFEGATHMSREITEANMTTKQIVAYKKGYENETDRKDWGEEWC